MHLCKAITWGYSTHLCVPGGAACHVAVTETLNFIISVSYCFLMGNFIHVECLNLIFPESQPFSVLKSVYQPLGCKFALQKKIVHYFYIEWLSASAYFVRMTIF